MPSSVELPRGTVTFLFTDIEGSTRLLKELGDRYADALIRHRQVLTAVFESRGGLVFGTEGDALFVVFRRARDAVAAAGDGQVALAAEEWPEGVAILVRMGLHTGEPALSEDGYVGLALHKVARISSAGHGGQVLMSRTTRELVADDLPDELWLRDLGEHRLKDLDRPEPISELRYPGMVGAFPRIETLDVQRGGSPAGTPSLVGREDELEAVAALLAAARAGTGGVLVVEGPAGIGKTSLLRGARERAAGEGMTVLHGRATELERDYPMALARQCLEPAVRRERDRDRLLRGAAALAAPVLLDVAGPVEATPVGVLHGLYWLTASLAEDAPVLLVVDDAQWADESSLRFLAYLARRAEDSPIALLVAVRSEPGGADRETGPLAEIRLEASERRLEPRPLAVTDVEWLLENLSREPVDPVFARACHAATGGNPFLLGELATALRTEDVPFTAAGIARVTEVTPPAVARATAATLARLGDRAAALGRAAAILGGGVSLEQAARLADLSVAEAAAAAGDLAGAGILDDEVLLEFRHPILITAVRASVSARERATAHAEAATLLRDEGAAPERVAVQLLHASPSGDRQVVADLRLAAEHAAERGANATAASLLRRALAEPPTRVTRGEVLLDLGRVERALGDTTAAAGHLEESFRCAPDPVARGRAVVALVDALAGSPAERDRIKELAEATLAEVEELDRELALRLRSILALSGGRTEDLSLTGASLGEAVVLANLVFGRLGPESTAAEIAGLAERAAPWSEELLVSAPLAFTGVALGLTWADRLDGAGRVLDRAVAVARRRGSTTDYAVVMTLRARVHQRAGRLGEAEADARAALAVELEGGWSFARGLTPLIASLVDQGRADDALDELAAVGLQHEVPASPPMTALLLARMQLHVARHDHQAALADWAEAAHRAQRLRGRNAGWIADLVAVAGVHRAIGEDDRAREAVEEAVELAGRWDTPGARGQALHARAMLGLDAERIEGLREAVRLLAASPVRLEHARALVSLGGALRRAGHRVDSRAPLREGYELARECGAEAVAEAARGELRASGIRLRRTALTGADALTPSERRIADLAAAGRSNAQVAQELFLTVKTVEMHLTHAYRKLDIRGRPELPAALA